MGDVARMEEKRNANQYVAEILRGIDHLKSLQKDCKKILKWISRKKRFKSIDLTYLVPDRVHVRSFSIQLLPTRAAK